MGRLLSLHPRLVGRFRRVGYSSCGDAALTPPGVGKPSPAAFGSPSSFFLMIILTGGTGAAPCGGWQPACGQAGAPPQAPQEEDPTRLRSLPHFLRRAVQSVGAPVVLFEAWELPTRS